MNKVQVFFNKVNSLSHKDPKEKRFVQTLKSAVILVIAFLAYELILGGSLRDQLLNKTIEIHQYYQSPQYKEDIKKGKEHTTNVQKKLTWIKKQFSNEYK